MFSFLKNLFKKPEGKHFQFIICDDNEEAELNKWYRLERWKSVNYLKMNTKWSRDWKKFASEVPVSGVTQGNRQSDFLIMGDQPDFKIFLERERDNPVDLNAIKVMGSATVENEKIIHQLGYIPKEVSEQLANEKEIDATPHSVYIPYADKPNQYGLRINVLVRSASYKKKKMKS
jgi:hypothetical protein